MGISGTAADHARGPRCRSFITLIAARQLGILQIPVLYVEQLSEAEENALSVALNRFYELGQFDQKLLGNLILDLEVQIPDLAFEDIGLEVAQVDRALRATELNFGPEEIPAVQKGWPVSQPGDLWLLDEHRILCGDATEPDSHNRLMGDRIAQMVWADPPYGIAISKISTRKRDEFVQGSGDMSRAELVRFFERWCVAMRTRLQAGGLVYLCIDWRSLTLLIEAASDAFGDLLNILVWVKDRAGMGSLYRSQHELILLFRMPGAAHRNNVELGRHGRNRSNVWNYPSALTFCKTDVEGDLLADHPTPKPHAMVADAILDCTRRGDIILDPFLGSGSTVVAAEKTGRTCFGMDLDPCYVDVAVRRWQNWTGKAAVNADSGELFSDIARNLNGEDNDHV